MCSLYSTITGAKDVVRYAKNLLKVKCSEVLRELDEA